MNLHIHDLTKGIYPEDLLVRYVSWTYEAVRFAPALAGFPEGKSPCHVYLKVVKGAPGGVAKPDGSCVIELPFKPFLNASGCDTRYLDSIDFNCYDWAEMLVSTAAHEFSHLRGVPGVAKSAKDVWGDRTGEQLAQVVSVAVLEHFRLVRAVLNVGLMKVTLAKK